MYAKKLRSAIAVVLLVTCGAMSGCGDSAVSPKSQVLRFSVIPDWNKGKLAADSRNLAKLLTEKLGVEVRYEQTNSYLACVNALAANKIDFAWLGGKTTCDAIDECKGAARDSTTELQRTTGRDLEDSRGEEELQRGAGVRCGARLSQSVEEGAGGA